MFSEGCLNLLCKSRQLLLYIATNHPSKSKDVSYKKKKNHKSDIGVQPPLLLQKYISVFIKISSYLQQYPKMLIVIKQEKEPYPRTNQKYHFFSLYLPRSGHWTNSNPWNIFLHSHTIVISLEQIKQLRLIWPKIYYYINKAIGLKTKRTLWKHQHKGFACWIKLLKMFFSKTNAGYVKFDDLSSK